MNTRLTRRIIVGGSAALMAVGALTACSPSTEKPAPSTSSATPSSSAPAVSPTEKAVGPTMSFSPTIKPNVPGAVCNQTINGVCAR